MNYDADVPFDSAYLYDQGEEAAAPVAGGGSGVALKGGGAVVG